MGRPLLSRGKRHISLTPEGVLFCKRAGEILELFRKTRSEVQSSAEFGGDIYFGAGETDVIRRIAQVASQFAQIHPGVRYHVRSGDADAVREMLEKGLVDFGLVYGPSDPVKYRSVELAPVDHWGILLPRTHPLAACAALTPEQVRDLPLILSKQALDTGLLQEWLGRSLDMLHVAATYTLLTNAAKMVAGGLGCAMGLDGLINTAGTEICFRPCNPPLPAGMSLIWKKGQLFTPAVQGFLDELVKNFKK
jgi:DNA-binding transcriptional LysR family regulator